MNARIAWRRLSALLLLFFCWGMPRAATAQTETPRAFAQLLNQMRLAEGRAPLGWSTLLAQAAQRHADDMAAHTLITSAGSDGSTYQQRIREAGYRAWNDGLLVNEAVWAGLGEAGNALNWFRSKPEQWPAFINPEYREVGVGYAEDGQGVHYLVVTFGARPGVLPIFINDGAAAADSPVVSVQLTNEEAVPLGEGAWMGRAIEVRISDTPTFGDTPWQLWETPLPWLLPDTKPGEYAVYVEFRDGAGRTTISEDVIRLAAPGEALPPEPTLPPLAEMPSLALPTSEPPIAATPPASDELKGTPTIEPTTAPLPELSGTPAPTWTPLPPKTVDVAEAPTTDWPLWSAILLQAAAILLAGALFLRRR